MQKEVTTTKTEKEQVYDTVDLYNEDGEVIGTQQVERKETKTKTVTEIAKIKTATAKPRIVTF